MVRQVAGQVLLDFLDKRSRRDVLSFGRADRVNAGAYTSYFSGFTDEDVKREFSWGVRALDCYTRDGMTFYDSSLIKGAAGTRGRAGRCHGL
jgi:hypothetical protein